ncbi:hypothetical protein BURPSS13_C0163 [Burkholderia pseudomallei S13]|nr:hypothetical protein BURPSS13_C0163 [Burkholderia pseudomallei S13]
MIAYGSCGCVSDTTMQNGRVSRPAARSRATSKIFWRAANVASSSKSSWLVRTQGPASSTELML